MAEQLASQQIEDNAQRTRLAARLGVPTRDRSIVSAYVKASLEATAHTRARAALEQFVQNFADLPEEARAQLGEQIEINEEKFEAVLTAARQKEADKQAAMIEARGRVVRANALRREQEELQRATAAAAADAQKLDGAAPQSASANVTIDEHLAELRDLRNVIEARLAEPAEEHVSAAGPEEAADADAQKPQPAAADEVAPTDIERKFHPFLPPAFYQGMGVNPDLLLRADNARADDEFLAVLKAQAAPSQMLRDFGIPSAQKVSPESAPNGEAAEAADASAFARQAPKHFYEPPPAGVNITGTYDAATFARWAEQGELGTAAGARMVNPLPADPSELLKVDEPPPYIAYWDGFGQDREDFTSEDGAPGVKLYMHPKGDAAHDRDYVEVSLNQIDCFGATAEDWAWNAQCVLAAQKAWGGLAIDKDADADFKLRVYLVAKDCGVTVHDLTPEEKEDLEAQILAPENQELVQGFQNYLRQRDVERAAIIDSMLRSMSSSAQPLAPDVEAPGAGIPDNDMIPLSDDTLAGSVKLPPQYEHVVDFTLSRDHIVPNQLQVHFGISREQADELIARMEQDGHIGPQNFGRGPDDDLHDFVGGGRHQVIVQDEDLGDFTRVSDSPSRRLDQTQVLTKAPSKYKAVIPAAYAAELEKALSPDEWGERPSPDQAMPLHQSYAVTGKLAAEAEQPQTGAETPPEETKQPAPTVPGRSGVRTTASSASTLVR